MKILCITGSMDPRVGGPVEAIVRSAQAMAGLGHETDVVSLDLADAPFLASIPLTIHPVGDRNLFSRVRYTPHLVPWLQANARRYDVAIIHGLWNYSSIGAWRALANGPVPYVTFPHGSLDPWFGKAYPIKHVLKQAYWIAAEGKVMRDAQFVLFTTEDEQRLARAAFASYAYRGRVVAFGTADVEPDAERQIQSFRSRLPELKRPHLLFLSRIHRKKGCDLLIKAFSRIAAARPDIDLVIAGPDSTGWQSELQALARSLGVHGRIHWPGMLSGDAKWGAFRAAEAFVLPSHSENFGIVVAEALACGTPVLISDKVNIWREVEAGGAGLVAPDTEQGTEALLNSFFAASAGAMEKMRGAARRTFLAHFEIGQAAAQMEQVLEEATRRRPPVRGRRAEAAHSASRTR